MHPSLPKLKMRNETHSAPGHKCREDSPIPLSHNDLQITAPSVTVRMGPRLASAEKPFESHLKPFSDEYGPPQ